MLTDQKQESLLNQHTVYAITFSTESTVGDTAIKQFLDKRQRTQFNKEWVKIAVWKMLDMLFNISTVGKVVKQTVTNM